MTPMKKKDPINDFLHRKASGGFISSRFLTSIRQGTHIGKNQIMEEKIMCVKKIVLEDNVV